MKEDIYNIYCINCGCYFLVYIILLNFTTLAETVVSVIQFKNTSEFLIVYVIRFRFKKCHFFKSENSNICKKHCSFLFKRVRAEIQCRVICTIISNACQQVAMCCLQDIQFIPLFVPFITILNEDVI